MALDNFTFELRKQIIKNFSDGKRHQKGVASSSVQFPNHSKLQKNNVFIYVTLCIGGTRKQSCRD